MNAMELREIQQRARTEISSVAIGAGDELSIMAAFTDRLDLLAYVSQLKKLLRNRSKKRRA